MKAVWSRVSGMDIQQNNEQTDGQSDSECTDIDDTEDVAATVEFVKDSNPHTRELLSQEKKAKRKKRNKKIRKRVRRVLRTSWKWLRRGCLQLGPAVQGLGYAFGPVIRPFSTSTAGSKNVYGTRP